MERVIRGVITRAKENLGRVNYRNLNADANPVRHRETVPRAVEEALRPPQNLVFAKNLADKASALAAQLAGR